MDNKNKRKQKKPIRFAMIPRRLSEVIIVEIALSEIVMMFYNNLSGNYLGVILNNYVILSSIILVLFLISQWFILKLYCREVYSPIRYICTNALVYLIFGICISVLIYFNIESIFSWIKIPFLLFKYLDLMGAVSSSIFVTVILFIYTLLCPFTFISKRSGHTYYNHFKHYIKHKSKK